MKLSFDSMDELRAFLAEIDGDDAPDAAETATGTTRKKRETKAEKEARLKAEAAAIAANPNANIASPSATVAAQPAAAAVGFATQGQQGFAPPAVGASAQQAPFGTAGAAPAVHPLVAQIIAKTEASVAAGHPAESAVAWFRQALGPEAAQADWGQIKDVLLPRAHETLLKQIAPQFGIAV